MLKIGLTGGIGCGKTTVAQLFSRFDIPSIDADVIAHQIVQPGKPALENIAQSFGTELIKTDGSLDREKLRNLVFSDPTQKRLLENLLHPLIYAEIEVQIAQIQAAYCLICVPLLVETQKTSLVDRVLVVDCPVEMQVERIKSRSQLAEAQIYAIIATQASRSERLAVADDVIDNSKSAAYLAEQVKNLHNSYFLLSSV